MKPIFHRLYEWVIKSYVWVSLGAVSLTWFSAKISRDDADTSLLLFVFGGTLAVYNFHRWYNPKSHQNFKDSKFFVILLGGMISLFSFLAEMPFSALPVIAIAGFLSWYYVVPMGKGKSDDVNPSLREMSGKKLWVITLVWTFSTAALPYYWSSFKIPNGELFLIMFERFLFIAGITIPFDIRDVYLDKPELNTVPQQVGIPWSKVFAVILILWNGLLLINESAQIYSLVIATSASTLTSVIFIILSSSKRPKWFFSVLMDGLMIIHPWMIYFVIRII